MRKVGFVVNPIAGMGGRVGLGGTDGVAAEAAARGAEPTAPRRAAEMLSTLRTREEARRLDWLTCSGAMGTDSFRLADWSIPEDAEVYRPPHSPTTADDTKRACEAFLDRGAELIVFCGGDGTGRDVATAMRDRVPILGVPAGVKMHSGVFAVHAGTAADLVAAWVRGELDVGDAEILDLDETAYRRGEWHVRLFGTAKTLREPNLVPVGKMVVAEVSEDAIRDEIAEHLKGLIAAEPDAVFLLGPGSTVEHVAKRLGIAKSPLGIDAVRGGRAVARDLDERGLLRLLDAHPRAKLVVSPIGAQGFILGRGNLQLSPAVLRRIGPTNVVVIATPAKLAVTPVLRVDTGDPGLDAEFARRSYWLVVVGYKTSRLHPIQS